MTPAFQVFVLGCSMLFGFWLIGLGGVPAIVGWFLFIAIGLYAVFVLIFGIIVCVGLGALVGLFLDVRK